MLSNKERMYLQDMHQFEKVYGKNYSKRIRSAIRKKSTQAAIDFYYILNASEEFIGDGIESKRKELNVPGISMECLWKAWGRGFRNPQSEPELRGFFTALVVEIMTKQNNKFKNYKYDPSFRKKMIDYYEQSRARRK